MKLQLENFTEDEQKQWEEYIKPLFMLMYHKRLNCAKGDDINNFIIEQKMVVEDMGETYIINVKINKIHENTHHQRKARG